MGNKISVKRFFNKEAENTTIIWSDAVPDVALERILWFLPPYPDLIHCSRISPKWDQAAKVVWNKKKDSECLLLSALLTNHVTAKIPWENFTWSEDQSTGLSYIPEFIHGDYLYIDDQNGNDIKECKRLNLITGIIESIPVKDRLFDPPYDLEPGYSFKHGKFYYTTHQRSGNSEIVSLKQYDLETFSKTFIRRNVPELDIYSDNRADAIHQLGDYLLVLKGHQCGNYFHFNIWYFDLITLEWSKADITGDTRQCKDEIRLLTLNDTNAIVAVDFKYFYLLTIEEGRCMNWKQLGLDKATGKKFVFHFLNMNTFRFGGYVISPYLRGTKKNSLEMWALNVEDTLRTMSISCRKILEIEPPHEILRVKTARVFHLCEVWRNQIVLFIFGHERANYIFSVKPNAIA